MEKIIKPLFCYLCAVMVLFSCVFFAMPANASGMPSGVVAGFSESGVFANFDSDTVSVTGGWCNTYVITEQGEYLINFGDGEFPLRDNSGLVYHAVSYIHFIDGVQLIANYDFESPFELVIDDTFDYVELEEGVMGYCLLMVNSYNEPAFISDPPVPSLYDSAWAIFQQYIYGNGVMTPEQHLVLTLLATLIALAVVLLPFFIVWWIIRLVASLMR